MVKPAKTDIVCPAVAAHDPDTFLHQIIRERKEMLCVARFDIFQLIFEEFDPSALFENLRFVRLVRAENGVR